MGSVVTDPQLARCGLWTTVDIMSTITIGIDTSRSYNRKVPPGGKCSDLFSSNIELSEPAPLNKPRKIDRQRSSIDFAPDISGVTKGLERQISEPVPAKPVDLPSEPRDPTVSSGTEKGATKPTEIDGKIKSNGVEPKSVEAKPKNSSLEDASSASEAKPVEVKNTDPLDPPTPSAKPKCSEPEITRNSSSDDVKQPTAQPKQVENAEPAKVEPSTASQIKPEKSEEKVETSSSEPPPAAPVRTAARRVPPGGHCSQLW